MSFVMHWVSGFGFLCHLRCCQEKKKNPLSNFSQEQSGVCVDVDVNMHLRHVEKKLHLSELAKISV